MLGRARMQVQGGLQRPGHSVRYFEGESVCPLGPGRTHSTAPHRMASVPSRRLLSPQPVTRLEPSARLWVGLWAALPQQLSLLPSRSFWDRVMLTAERHEPFFTVPLNLVPSSHALRLLLSSPGSGRGGACEGASASEMIHLPALDPNKWPGTARSNMPRSVH